MSTNGIHDQTSRREVRIIHHAKLIPVMTINIEGESLDLTETLRDANVSEELQIQFLPEVLNRRAEKHNVTLSQKHTRTKRTGGSPGITLGRKSGESITQTSIRQSELSNSVQLGMFINIGLSLVRHQLLHIRETPLRQNKVSLREGPLSQMNTQVSRSWRNERKLNLLRNVHNIREVRAWPRPDLEIVV